MRDPLPPEADPDLIDSTDEPAPEVEVEGRTAGAATPERASPGTWVLGMLVRFGRWLVRRRTPLLLIPMLAALIVVGSIGAQMLLEEVPEPEANAPPVICWDKQEAPTAQECSTPTGTPGLRWVFPSFAPRKDGCRELADQDPDSRRPTQWQCGTTFGNGVTVQVSYIELAGAKSGRTFYSKRFAGSDRVEVADREGNVFRYEWRQPTEEGFELATVYKDFPFAVTVESKNAAFRNKVFRSRVKLRQPKGVLVRRYPEPAPDPDQATEEPEPPADEQPAAAHAN